MAGGEALLNKWKVWAAMRVFTDLPADWQRNPMVAPLEAVLRRRDELRQDPKLWSWAEVGPDEEDYLWLIEWMAQRTAAEWQDWLWLDRPEQSRGPVTIQPSECVRGRPVQRRVIAGAMLTVFFAEVGRRDGTEDELWPAVRAAVPAELHTTLFRGGDLVDQARTALRRAGRELGLRHVHDDDEVGQHSWVTTLRLQFGLTHDGLQHRLADWLAGGNRPRAIRSLLEGELVSERFVGLWCALCDLQKGTGSAERHWQVINQSPWLLESWREEVAACLGVARPRATIRTTAAASGVDGAVEARALVPAAPTARLVRQALLRWPPREAPYFELQMANVAGLQLADRPPRAVLRRGTEVVGRLYGQASGYRAEWEEAALRLRLDRLAGAEVLLEVATGDGTDADTVRAEDVPLWDDGAEFVLFDLSDGQPADLGDPRLRLDREYALLVAPGVAAEPAERRCSCGAKGWQALRVPHAALSEVRVQRAGKLLWQLTGADDADWLAAVVAEATAGAVRVGADLAAKVWHPTDLRVDSACWRGRPLDMVREGDDSTLLRGIPVPPGPWGAALTIRLTLTRHGRTHVVSRVVATDRVGVSVKADGGWRVAGPEWDVGRHGTDLAIVHAPQPSPSGRNWQVTQGAGALAGVPLDRPTRLPELRARGEPVELRGVRFDGKPAEPLRLLERVVDRGKVARLDPAADGWWRLVLRQALPLTPEHRVVWWDRDGPLGQAGAEMEAGGSAWLVAPPADGARPRAVGIEFRDDLLGAGWVEDWAEGIPAEVDRLAGLQAMDRLGLPVFERGALGHIVAWLKADVKVLLELVQNGVEGVARELAAAALAESEPLPGGARRLLLERPAILAQLAGVRPRVLRAVVVPAAEGKQPLCHNYWQALARVGCLLAEKPPPKPSLVTKDACQRLVGGFLVGREQTAVPGRPALEALYEVIGELR